MMRHFLNLCEDFQGKVLDLTITGFRNHIVGQSQSKATGRGAEAW